MQALDAGYTAEFDSVEESTWHVLLKQFVDANIYQTWPYAEVTCGRRNISHLVLRKDGAVAALAQARIAKVPFINIGIAYIHWGPLWRTSTCESPAETLRQAVRALRNEYAYNRGLVLRLFPALFDSDPPCFSTILAEEGFSSVVEQVRSRTILMDLRPSLGDLRDGMLAHWKRELKVAERNGLEIVEGTEQELFDLFIEMYKEMVSRKKFIEPNDIYQFRRIQEQLPGELKMNIMLCRSGKNLCSGLICSAIGSAAIYLFGATSNVGMKSRGSYILQWKLLSRLKARGTSVYNLNGINPAKNPGTYSFKNELAGRNGIDVQFLGRFDSAGSLLSSSCVGCGDAVRAMYRRLRRMPGTVRDLSLGPKIAN
jgi:hypothetical protein